MSSTANTKSTPVAIIGGGIGGLCLAIGLEKHGIPYHIYEAAHHFSEIGAGVAFGPNAQRAMALIDPRIKEAYDRRSNYNQDELKDVYFQYRLGMDGKGKAQGRKAGELITEVGGPGLGISMIHRAHFLDELIKLVPQQKASFNKRVVDYYDKGSEGVQIHFQDGTQVDAAIAIGCDGIKSHMRRSLLGKQSDATFTGKYTYRGLLPMSKAISLLGETRALNAQAYLGYDGHILTMPIENFTIMNVVAFRTKPDNKWDNEQWVVPMEWDALNADYEGWGPSVKKILTLMEKPDIWALFNHPPASTYFKGSVALLGDAAHAATPHQGSGAGMAVEDAYVLSELLSYVENPHEDLEAAFAAYDQVRRPRTQKVVTTSEATGRIYEFQHEKTGDDLDAVAAELKDHYMWIWKNDLEADMEKAKEIFESGRGKKV